MPQTKPSQTKASTPAPVTEAGRAPAAGVTGAGTRLRDIDRLIDEIDSVLEENASEFVKGYVQRGGESPRPVDTSGGSPRRADAPPPGRPRRGDLRRAIPASRSRAKRAPVSAPPPADEAIPGRGRGDRPRRDGRLR